MRSDEIREKLRWKKPPPLEDGQPEGNPLPPTRELQADAGGVLEVLVSILEALEKLEEILKVQAELLASQVRTWQ